MSHSEGKDGETRPLKASAFRKGGYIMLKGKPCKIVDMSTSKTGKHGHAKVKFTGIDIFTGKKYQELQSSTHAMNEVIVTKTEYVVMGLDDGELTLLDNDNQEGPAFTLDEENEEHAAVQSKWDDLGDEDELIVIITSAVGKLALQGHRTQKAD